MNMTLDVSGNCVFGPFPILQSLGEELELARWRRKPDASPAVDFYADGSIVFRDNLARLVDGRIRELRRFDGGLVNFVDMILDEKCAVFAHVLQRRQALLSGGFGKARNAVLEDPAVVIIDGHLLARFVG